MSYVNPLRSEKKQREPTYNLKAGQLHEMTKRGVLDGMAAGIYTCNAMYSVAMLMVLHDTLGFGQKRLERIHLRVQKLFDEIVSHEISYEDLAETLHEECHINLIIEKTDSVKQSALDLFREFSEKPKLTMQIGRKK